MISRAAAVLAVLAMALPATMATNYYVSDVGHDTECNGLSNAAWDPFGGAGQTCAFKTPTKAYSTSACGDTIRLIGSVYDERLSLSKACTAGNVLTITSDTGTAVWHVGQVDVTSCTLSSGSSYTCTIPSGGVTAGTSREDCFGQLLTSGVAWSDLGGVDGTLSNYACMTEHTTTASVDTTPGSWVVSGGNYYVHLWNDEVPSGSGKIFAPTTGAGSNQACLTHTGAYHTINNVDIVSGCELGVYDLGDHLTMQDVDHYTGTLWVTGTHPTFRRVVSLNQLRRPLNGSGTTGTSWDVSAGNQTWANVGASDFLIEDSEAKNAREAFSFSGNAGPGSIDGFKVHAMFNHGFKFINTAHDITVNNVVSWDCQEAMFMADCIENITFQHCTFAEQQINIHDNTEGASCANHTPNGPLNIDFYDNVIHSMMWLPNFGDARSGARGHDFDYNVYMDDVDPGNGAQTGAWQYHSPTSSQIKTITDWQNWATDTCTNCTRGPHSVEAPSMESVFVSWAAHSDALMNWHLEAGALAVDLSNATYNTPRGTDVDVDTRDANEDAGADEYTGVTDCNDGVDNDSDGATDYPNDYGCTNSSDTSEVGATQCGDGIDNDGDTFIDQNDPDCTGAADDSEAAAPPPSPNATKLRDVKAKNVKVR